MNFQELYESLDQIHPIRRVDTDKAYIYDEWEFDEGSKTFTVRFSRVKPSVYGPKVTRVEFGQRRGRTIRKTLVGVQDVRKYLATVVAILDQALEDPTKKMKTKSQGIIFIVDNKLFDQRGVVLTRILKRRFRNKLKFHDSHFDYDDMDDVNAIYAWKKERSFKSVFTGDTFDTVEEPAEQEIKTYIQKSIKDMLSTDQSTQEKQPLEKEEEPVVQSQLEPKQELPKTNVEKVREARKKYIPITEKVFDKSLYLEVLVATKFFKPQIPNYRSGPFDKKGKNSMGQNETSEFTLEMMTNVMRGKDQEFSNNTLGLLSLYEYLLALNLSGIKTNDTWDYYPTSSYDKPGYDSFFTSRVKDIVNIKEIQNNIPETPRKNVTFAEIMGIIENAESILRSNGISGNVDRSKNNNLRPMKLTNTIGSVIHDAGLSKAERRDFYKTLIASIPEHQIEHFDPYKYEESSKGKKKVKERKYSTDDPILSELITFSPFDAAEISDSLEDFKELLSLMPSFSQSFFSDDPEFFEVSWVSAWTLTGGSSAQYVATKTANDLEINEQLNDFWHPQLQMTQGIYDEALQDPELREKIKGNFKAIYEKNQEFFRQKFKKKYETKTIKLYRGVGLGVVDTYIPGALESWTTAIGTAKRFAEMMSRQNEDYTILTAEVPIQHIFGSFESFTETWPGEEDLKGKKEYVVMGGTFATTPLYVYDVGRKEPTKELKSFREWALYEGSENMKKKQVTITTPSMPGFAKVLKSGKAALGNDSKEHEARKSETKKSTED